MSEDIVDTLAEEILITEEVLQTRIAELAQAISDDYRGKDLLLICVLKGAVMFLVDLMRHITIPHAIDFMAVSSYGPSARQSTGVVRILMDLSTSITNRNVLIVEDIIDSGRTLHYIARILNERNPASLRICTLLNKSARREVEIDLDYMGFDISDKFVFGYGLDLDELYRSLPFIAVVKPDVYLSSAP